MEINNNLNAMLSSQMQITENASKIAEVANVVGDPQLQEVSQDLIDTIVGQIPEMIAYQANAQGVEMQAAVLDTLLDIKA